MNKFSGYKTTKGQPIFTQEYAQSMRNKNTDRCIVAQLGGQEDMLASPADINITGGQRGGPLLTDTRVVTPFGYRRIGDLKTGDIISSTDGGQQRVLYRKDFKNLPCYKLSFIDGSSIVCSYDHLWNVRRTCYNSKKRILNNTTLSEDWRTWTTEMIVERLEKEECGKIKNGHLVIPVCRPIQFTIGASCKRIKIPPYLLGVLIGNGCMTDTFMKYNNVMFSTSDKEVVSEIEMLGYEPRMRSKSKDIDYIFKSKEVVDALKEYGLAGHAAISKFVPRAYKFGTIETRFAILQGLMDTDGTIDKRGHCSYTTISHQLAEDVKFIVNSLGGLATISKYEASYKDKRGNRVICNDAYTIYIKIPNSYKIFRLKRKQSLSTEYNGGVSEYTRRIVGCEYVGTHDCCCIAVDNTNSLFMAEDFIVTHNSKSFSLLLEGLKDVQIPRYKACILRNEKPDLADLIEVSDEIYKQFGEYNKSQNDMTWNFNAGGTLKFSYYGDDWEKFKKRFQGKQFAFIGIDEITHCPFRKFKYLITDNRNAHHIRNRFWGTCNPDPDSWVAQYIDWWIDDDGYPIPERNGKIRYCYMPSNEVGEVVWGDTREEVFELCKDDILKHWKPAFDKYGTPAELSVKSVSFVEAKLSDNKKLMESDPSYVGNLMNQDEEQQSRDLDGNWKFRAMGDDMIKLDDMETLFSNSEQTPRGERFATADVALQGGDNFVMWLWIDWHIKDVFVCRLDSKTLMTVVKAKLNEWGVEENHFTYDLNGIGQILGGYFPDAVPFNNMGAPIPQSKTENIKALYKDLKSQSAYMLYKKIRDAEVSIDNHLLEMHFDGHGYGKTPLRDILRKERKCIRRTQESDGKAFQIINKRDMKKLIGHSPDFFESLIFRVIFVLQKKTHRKAKGTWRI